MCVCVCIVNFFFLLKRLISIILAFIKGMQISSDLTEKQQGREGSNKTKVLRTQPDQVSVRNKKYIRILTRFKGKYLTY